MRKTMTAASPRQKNTPDLELLSSGVSEARPQSPACCPLEEPPAEWRELRAHGVYEGTTLRNIGEPIVMPCY